MWLGLIGLLSAFGVKAPAATTGSSAVLGGHFPRKNKRSGTAKGIARRQMRRAHHRAKMANIRRAWA